MRKEINAIVQVRRTAAVFGLMPFVQNHCLMPDNIDVQNSQSQLKIAGAQPKVPTTLIINDKQPIYYSCNHLHACQVKYFYCWNM